MTKKNFPDNKQIYRRLRDSNTSDFFSSYAPMTSEQSPDYSLKGIKSLFRKVSEQKSPGGQSEHIHYSWHNFIEQKNEKKSGSSVFPLNPNSVSIFEDQYRIHEIALRNRSAKTQFIPNGTLFLGAAQNRILLEDTFVKPGLNILPVFCVEAGRWDSDERFFHGTSRIPALIRYRFLQQKMKSPDYLQLYIWDFNQETLALFSEYNPNMDLSAIIAAKASLPKDLHLKKSLSRYTFKTDIDKDSIPQDETLRVLSYSDSYLGFHNLELYPQHSILFSQLDSIANELQWQSEIHLRLQNAFYEYFRIFNAGEKIGIKCLPDGRPLKTNNGNFFLFHYHEYELTPYDAILDRKQEQKLDLKSQKDPLSQEDLLQLLDESHGHSTKDKKRLFFSHPRYPLLGTIRRDDQEKILSLSASLLWN